ncbi:MAG: pyridoxamine 5'-phosphate oxidase family protein [Anaerolineae bacterium]|nr:pyridoxamine 5'-phosphate oxidase family protein [Anaerolineae bacterium]
MPKKDYNLHITPANAQRRPEHVQDDAWICDFLARTQIGHIATRWDEQPFINPTTFWYNAERHEIIFHSNVVGRVRANSERHDQVCFEAGEFGRLLPSNVALEFSIQYESVIAFGRIRLLEDFEEKRRALYGLIGKYFPAMIAGQEYRPITDKELKRTSVYAIAIDSWSGKRNWAERADQSDEWPALGEEWFE